jgi:uncharacterized protein
MLMLGVSDAGGRFAIPDVLTQPAQKTLRIRSDARDRPIPVTVRLTTQIHFLFTQFSKGSIRMAAETPRRTSPHIRTPGVYIKEIVSGSRPIQAVGTSAAGFVGMAPKSAASNVAAPVAQVIDSWPGFKRAFFNARPDPPATAAEVKTWETAMQSWHEGDWTNLAYAVYGFFLNGGYRCWVVDIGNDKTATQLEKGLDALRVIDEVSIVAAPGLTDKEHYDKIRAHCLACGDRVGILDVAQNADLDSLDPATESATTQRGFTTMYAPWLQVANPHPQYDSAGFAKRDHVSVPPSGHVAGIWARSDATRGIHKAPANEIVNGAMGLTQYIDDQTQATLSARGINTIRYFKNAGYLVWGARTLATDQEWRYLNVRRLCNMIEESITESTRWIVFEPNDEFLWAAIRRDINAFLLGFWRQGMLMGSAPQEAFFVKCDAENNTNDDIRRGRVIIDIGIAPVLPDKFVIFRISQYEAGSEVEIT